MREKKKIILSNIGNIVNDTWAVNLQWGNSMVDCWQGRTRAGTCKSEKNMDWDKDHASRRIMRVIFRDRKVGEDSSRA